MNFYLVGGVSYILTVVFRFLVFDKIYSYSVYFSEFIDSFKVMVDGLIEEGCKFLVVEDFKVIVWRNFVDRGGVKFMVVVVVTVLDKYIGVI